MDVAAHRPLKEHCMDWKIELIPVPVTDYDRAKRFYEEQAGWHLDHDRQVSEDMRVIQLTPPGSACSIVLGLVDSEPGSLRAIHIVVPDIEQARTELIKRGVDVSDITHYDHIAYAHFSDPDGNSWTLQEIGATP